MMLNKRCLITASAALGAVWLASTAMAQTGPVYSVNMMGFQRIPLPSQGMVLAALPYEQPSRDINDVLEGQLTPGFDPGSADMAYFFDVDSQTYKTAYYYTDGSTTYWVDTDTELVATNPIVSGSGFWVKNNQYITNNVVVFGDVITDPVVTNRVFPGLQLLSYPYSAPRAVNDLTLGSGAVAGETPESADALYLWDADAQQFITLYYYFDNSWIELATGNAATNVLTVGQGFWYRHAGSGFDWVESKPYASP